MTLVHCPEGERLFKEMQETHFDGLRAWLIYRAHRKTCKECGMKDD